jgi:hypothetical protein
VHFIDCSTFGKGTSIEQIDRGYERIDELIGAKSFELNKTCKSIMNRSSRKATYFSILGNTCLAIIKGLAGFLAILMP